MAVEKTITLDEFVDFIRQDENTDKLFELIGGEVVEVSPSFVSAAFAAEILRLVGNWVAAQSPRPGYMTGADGGYIMPGGQKFNPDVAYITKARLPEKPKPGTEAPIPPDFTVEIVSPSDLQHRKERIEQKKQTYLDAKIPLLWYFFPQREQVEVYAYSQYIDTVGVDGTLDGRDVFPGLSIAVKALFED